MEGYAAGGRGASADAGLAVLMGELAGLACELAGAGAARSFDEIEQQVMVRGRVLLRKLIQHVVDGQAAAERRLAGSLMPRGCRGPGPSGGTPGRWSRSSGRW